MQKLAETIWRKVLGVVDVTLKKAVDIIAVGMTVKEISQMFNISIAQISIWIWSKCALQF